MDKISVTDNALQKAEKSLKTFEEEANRAFLNCNIKISEVIENLDEKFKITVKEHMHSLRGLCNDINIFCDKNKDALRERLVMLLEYEKCKYNPIQ